MKVKGLLAMAALMSALPSVANAQRRNGGFVVDLRTYTVVATFDSGEDPGGALWTTTSTAYVVNGQSLRRLGISNPARPTVTSSVAPLLDPTYYIGINSGDAAVNAAGTRAYLANAMTTTSTTALLLAYDTTRRPMRRVATVSAPRGDAFSGRIEAIALYRNDQAAIMTAGSNVLFATIINDTFTIRAFPFPTTDPVDPAFPTYATGVAIVNTSTAVITNQNGGLQAFNYARLPPTPLGGVVAPLNCGYSPSLALIPERVTGIRAPRIAAVMCTGTGTTAAGTPAQIGFVNLDGGMPFLDHTLQLPSPGFNSTQPLAVNPVNGEIYFASGTTLGVSAFPWTTINRTVPFNQSMFVGRAGISVSPDGRYAMVVGWGDLSGAE